MRGMNTTLRLVLALATSGLGACSVQDTPPPPLAGPSELALALHLQAVPDSIVQDGFSQSAITIEALGPDGRPVRALPLRIEITVAGTAVDYGTLSARTLVTGDDGRARLTYTAPPRPAESTGRGTVVTLLATPFGNDYTGAISRSVDLRLLPPGVILPPNGAPVPAITVTPTPVTAYTSVTFDASGTTDEGVACGGRCTYTWNFGDGGTGAGMVVRHEFRAAGAYTVRLTVVDDRGTTATTTQTLTVQASAAPTADFVFSPTSPLPGQIIFFNASASRPAPGRRIVSYDWDFGSGRSDQGVTVSKGYNTPGTYVVTLKVTDDANQESVISKPITVGVVTPPASGSIAGQRPPSYGK